MFANDNEVADAFCALLVTDRPDGLWSTVVVDERRVTLGLAYSSAESVRLAVARRRGVYQSRKRGVWVKGETSGTPQDLLEIEVDCDRDAVVFVVRESLHPLDANAALHRPWQLDTRTNTVLFTFDSLFSSVQSCSRAYDSQPNARR